MLEIQLEDGTILPLHGKSLLVLPPGSRQTNVVTDQRNEWDVILIVGGVDRTLNIELHSPAIIVLYAGVRTEVNVNGGMALPISQVVFVHGVDNVVNGIATQNRGRIVQAHNQEFDLSAIGDFSRIDIRR
jgi:hypothetical protein